MTVKRVGKTRAVAVPQPLTVKEVYGAVIGYRQRTGVWPKWLDLESCFPARAQSEVRQCVQQQRWRLEVRTDAGADRIFATDVPMLLEEHALTVRQATPEDIARIDAALAAKPKPKAWGDYEVPEGRAADARRRFQGQVAGTKAAQRPGFVPAVAPLPVLPEPPQEKGVDPVPYPRKLPPYEELLHQHEAGASIVELEAKYNSTRGSIKFALSQARKARETREVAERVDIPVPPPTAPEPQPDTVADLPYQPLITLTPGTAITIPGGNRASAELLAQITAAIQALGTARVITPEIRIEIPA